MASNDGGASVAVIYKITDSDAWSVAVSAHRYDGSAHDARDGFIHFSTEAQLAETARKHFSNQDGLVLIAVSSSALGPALVWEPSRGGALFPHLYASLDPSAALWVRPLPLAGDGVPDIASVLHDDSKRD